MTKKKKRAVSKRKQYSFKMRHGSGDLVSIQISARLKRVPKGVKITRTLIASMVRRKAETSSGFWNGNTVVGAAEGIDPKGIELKIIRWKNPDRDIAGDRAWRYPGNDQASAWGSLRHAIAKAGNPFR